MRELFSLFTLPLLAQSALPDLDSAGRFYEKLGSLAITIGISAVLAWMLYKKNDTIEKARTVREEADRVAREKRETEANAERLAMQTEIRDLNRMQLQVAVDSAKDSARRESEMKRAVDDHATALRMLTIKLKRGCSVFKADESDPA